MKSYLTFTTDNLTFAVATDYVVEIITNYQIRTVPKSPNFISGIINLRGQIIPVMDMRLRLGKDFLPYTEATCIVILDIDDELIGLAVDTVLQVQDLDDTAVSPLPTPKSEELANQLLTIATGKVALILDATSLLEVDTQGE